MKKLARKILRPPYNYTRYFILRYLKNRQYKPFELYHRGLNLKQVSPCPINFFGYYNVSPENDCNKIIYCVADKSKKDVDVIINDNGTEHIIDSTASWNWQQGCMSQWGYTNKNLAYYNRFNSLNDSYECVIFDSKCMKIKDTLPMPVYALAKQEDYALSLNFDRLAIMRPDYGYFCHQNSVLPNNDHDGIWRINIDTKQTSLIITLQQLIDLKPSDTMDGATHKVNHIDIAPDGKRFMFLHRWVGPKGRYMRLITANSDGSDLYILNGDKMTSHSFWINNQQIISFCHTPETGDAYVLFNDKSNKYNLISPKLPHSDGHPSTINGGEWIITDTYPQHDGMSKLFLYNTKTDKLYCIGRFYQPLRFTGTNRIDLHPKWNMNNNTIYFESGHDGRRKLYSINISSLLK